MHLNQLTKQSTIPLLGLVCTTALLSACATTAKLEPREDYMLASVQAIQTAKAVKQVQTECGEIDLPSANKAQSVFNAWAARNNEYVGAAHSYINYMKALTKDAALLSALNQEINTGAMAQHEAALESVTDDGPRCDALLNQIANEEHDISNEGQVDLLEQLQRALVQETAADHRSAVAE